MGIGSKIFLFIGPPGSGKGSLSNLCIKEFGWKQLSTGNLCRKHIGEGTEIGKQIDFSIKSGKLVSDTIIIEMVNKWLNEQLELGENIILDGYPRNLDQAKALDKFLKDKIGNIVFHVIVFELPDDVIIERLCERYVCQNSDCQVVYSMIPGSKLSPKKDMICDVCSGPLKRRSDDLRDSVIERLKIYHEHEGSLLNFYKNSGQMVMSLNAKKPLSEVFYDFSKLVGLEDL